MIKDLPLEEFSKEVNKFCAQMFEGDCLCRIVGIIYCQPSPTVNVTDNNTSHEYFHYSSGKRVNLHFLGYYGISRDLDSSLIFNECRERLQVGSTKWHYQNGREFVLCSATYNSKERLAQVEFQPLEPSNCKGFECSGHGASERLIIDQIFRFCEREFDAKPVRNHRKAEHMNQTENFTTQNGATADSSAAELEKYAVIIRADIQAGIKSFRDMDAEARETIKQANAAAEILKEVSQPFREMYKDERLWKVKSDSMRVGVPESVADAIVAEYHAAKFPTVDRLCKLVWSSGIGKKLEQSGKGTSRSTIAEWHRKFRNIMLQRGLMQKPRQSRSGAPINKETKTSQSNCEGENGLSDNPGQQLYDSDESENDEEG